MKHNKAVDFLIKESKRQRIRQIDLAKSANLTQAEISRIFNSSRHPRLEAMAAIANALHIPPEQILRMSMPELFPRQPEAVEETERIIYYFSHYKYPETKRSALEYLRYLMEQEKRNKKPSGRLT